VTLKQEAFSLFKLQWRWSLKREKVVRGGGKYRCVKWSLRHGEVKSGDRVARKHLEVVNF